MRNTEQSRWSLASTSHMSSANLTLWKRNAALPTKIAKLTPEQAAMMPEWTDRWLAVGLSTEPADWERAEAAVRGCYAAAKLKQPRVVLRMGSPFAATLGGATAVLLLDRKKQVWSQVADQVRSQVRSQVEDQVRSQVRSQVEDQVRSQVRSQVEDHVRSQVEAQVWSQVADQVADQVRSQVEAQVWSQVADQVWSQVDAQVWSQVADQVRSQVAAQVWPQVAYQVRSQVEAQVRSQVRSQVGAQ